MHTDKIYEEAARLAVATLNEALEADPEAMVNLFNFRVGVNDKLVNHPTIQVSNYRGKDKIYTMSILGLINGLFGTLPNGCGRIGVDVEIDDSISKRITKINKFELTKAVKND